MRWLKKENIIVNHRRHQSIRIENLKKYLLEIENIEENKWACEDNGHNVPGHSKSAWTCLACRAEGGNRDGCLKHI